MEKKELKEYFQTIHQTAWKLIKKIPEALKKLQPEHGENIANTLKIDADKAYSMGTKAMLTLALLFGGSKMSAQNYQVGQTVRLPGGLTGTVVKSPTQQSSTTNRRTVSYTQASQQYSQPQRSSSGYGHTQSPLAVAQNVIINNNLVIDAKLTEGLNKDEFAYACFKRDRNIIQLVRNNGTITQTTRSRCFNNQSGCCDEYCGDRHIGIREAQQLADAGIPVANHTNETGQAYNSAMIDNAIMDGAVASPREESIALQRAGFHPNRDLSRGINPEANVYQILTRGREEAVIIYRTPHIDEQTGEATCVELTSQGYLKSQKAGNAYPYDVPTRNHPRGWYGRGGYGY